MPTPSRRCRPAGERQTPPFAVPSLITIRTRSGHDVRRRLRPAGSSSGRALASTNPRRWYSSSIVGEIRIELRLGKRRPVAQPQRRLELGQRHRGVAEDLDAIDAKLRTALDVEGHEQFAARLAPRVRRLGVAVAVRAQRSSMRLVESSSRSSSTDPSRSTGTSSSRFSDGSGSPLNTTRTRGPGNHRQHQVRGPIAVDQHGRHRELRLVVAGLAAVGDVALDSRIQLVAAIRCAGREVEPREQLRRRHARRAVDVDRADRGARTRIDREHQRRPIRRVRDFGARPDVGVKISTLEQQVAHQLLELLDTAQRRRRAVPIDHRPPQLPGVDARHRPAGR